MPHSAASLKRLRTGVLRPLVAPCLASRALEFPRSLAHISHNMVPTRGPNSRRDRSMKDAAPLALPAFRRKQATEIARVLERTRALPGVQCAREMLDSRLGSKARECPS